MASRDWLDAVGSAGVEEPGEGAEGSPGTWEIQSSPSNHSARGWPNRNKPRPAAARAFATPTGAKQRTHRRYRQAKETKRGGKDGGKSQRPDSTDDARELCTPSDRAEGSGASDRSTSGRNYVRMHRNPPDVSPKRQRIAELARSPWVSVYVTIHSRVNGRSEEPYALMRARTDLWEPRAGQPPEATRPEANGIKLSTDCPKSPLPCRPPWRRKCGRTIAHDRVESLT